MKSTIITGITGQDGAYLAQLLLEKGYKSTVHIAVLLLLIFGVLRNWVSVIIQTCI